MPDILDMEDAKLRGRRSAQQRMARIRSNFHRPLIETQVGSLWEAINADPQVADYLRKATPDAFAEMERRYGNHTV